MFSQLFIIQNNDECQVFVGVIFEPNYSPSWDRFPSGVKHDQKGKNPVTHENMEKMSLAPRREFKFSSFAGS